MMVYVAELKLTRILYTISKGESSMNNVSCRRSLLSVKGYSNLDFSARLHVGMQDYHSGTWAENKEI